MAFSLVNGTGCKKTAQQDADLHAGIIGNITTVLPVGSQCRAEIMSSNKVRVHDGEFLCQGRRFNQPYGEYVDFTIDNGSQGAERYDIIGLRFSRNSDGKEACETFVRKDVGPSGTVREDNIREGATSCYMSMYRVNINGINIKSVTALFGIVDPITQLTKKVALAMYPIGAIYMSTKPTNPSEYFGGTWVPWGAGRVPVGVDASQAEFNVAEKTGGEKTHALTIDEMPKHSHASGNYNKMGSIGLADRVGTEAAFAVSWSYISTRTDLSLAVSEQGSNVAHNNLQPYITCYMWKRTA